MKKVLFLFMCMLMLVVVGCGSSHNNAPKNEKVLRVGTDADFPPFEYYQEISKTYTGFDIGLMSMLAKEMGYDKVEYVNTQFEDLEKGLNEKKFDLAISDITITKERSEKVLFSDAYLNDTYRVVVKSDNSLNELKGKKVAAERGSYSEVLAQKAEIAELIGTDGIEDALKLVVEGKADGVIVSEVTAKFYMNQQFKDKVKFAEMEKLADDKLGIAAEKSNVELIAKVNRALSEVRRSGEYKYMYESYFAKQ